MQADLFYFIFKQLPPFALLAWLIYSSIVVADPKRFSRLTNYYFFDAIPNVFVTIGLLGTFLGIAYGLYHFNTAPDQIKESITELLAGLKIAFNTSIGGIILSLIFNPIVKWRQSTGAINEPAHSPEYKALTQVIGVLEEIKTQNTELQGKVIQGLLRKIDQNSTSMRDKIDEFADKLADSNANAIVSALQEIIEDFNDTFKSFIGQLVDKNFEKLTQSIDQLITWQQAYRTDIQGIKYAYETLIEKHQHFVSTTSTWVNTLDEIAGQSSHLKKIVDEFRAVFVEDSHFKSIIDSINESTSNLKQLSESSNSVVSKIESSSEDFRKATQDVSTWLEKEEGVKEMVVALTTSLAELRQFDITQVENLEESFNKRLSSTFKGLDDVMKEQLKYMEKKSNNR